MHAARLLLALAATACGASTVLADALAMDPSYVVQIHASRDGFVPPEDASEQLRTQFMTTETGHRFECFVPLSPMQKEQRTKAREATKQLAEPAGEASADDTSTFLAFARAASKKVRPTCLQYVDVVDRWVYEICPGVLIRKVSLRRRAKPVEEKVEGDAPPPEDESVPESKPVKVHEVKELASFASESEQTPLTYEEFVHGDVQVRVSAYTKPMYTQVFHGRGAENGQEGDISVQFVCSASARDDIVGAVDWRHREDNGKEPAAFVIVSRLFCNPKHADGDNADDKFTVASLLEPLAMLRTCVKRNEGWWSYEFCFGHGIRQYHRENDGKITAEFSLGSYDEKQNTALDASGSTLVTEHIDATHDSPRPAFVEMYSGGTHCKEFAVSTPRKSRVYFYCNQGGQNHHILSVKETQTCTYTIKISTPSVCDHPHFIIEEQKAEDKAEVVHCVPALGADDDDVAAQASAGTRAPANEPSKEAEAVREVEVAAT